MVDLAGIASAVGSAFIDWLGLFLAPLKNVDMLWIIVPIWGVWVFSEFFQEKKGTSFGNAITNGAVMLFVGIDWIRYIVRSSGAEGFELGAVVTAKVMLSVFVIIVSAVIIFLGVRGNRVVKYIGRVRESTYLMLMFTPIIYNVVELGLRNIMIIIAFFPLFYLAVAALDRFIPNPKAFDLEQEEKSSPDFPDIRNLGGGNI